MDSGTTVCYFYIGLLFFLYSGITISSQENTDTLYVNRFEDNDARTRHKRNASVPASDKGDKNASNENQEHLEIKPVPVWLADLENGKWYGSQHYMTRPIYKNNPHRRPVLCFNNVTRVEHNSTVMNHFLCPMQGQDDTYIHCCGGHPWQQHCCKKHEYDEENPKGTSINDLDLATGLGIAAVFIGCISACMFLYCCCCQRRPEIHDGIKLIWVRRSFGKEINRLEQPTYPNHLAVVSSRAASRNPSRAGSRQGSRNPSVCPSPSVSRRGSADPASVHLVPNKGVLERRKSGPELPSSVTITVTTPSDEHGPTEPLLKTTEQKVNV